MKKYIYLMLIFVKVKPQCLDDLDLNITEIISKYGYPVENHEIETEDDYLLNVFRIPNGRNKHTNKSYPYPVFLAHGLIASSHDFILLGPKRSLPYLLADHGYDVWLYNDRACWYSRKHKILNPDKDAEFWQFSWNEIGIYDIPEMIDYVLNITQRTKLNYIGHSQGTTVFFVTCSERPEYNDKIKLMVGLAPSAVFRHHKQPLVNMLVQFHRLIEKLSNDFHEHELIPFVPSKDLRTLLKVLCGKNHLLPYRMCLNFLLLLGEDVEMDENVIPFLFNDFHGGGSVRQALHYLQNIEAGTFRKYDWGKDENIKRYNSEYPPNYNYKNMTVPVALFYGENDIITAKENVEVLGQLLPNVIEIYKVPSKKWAHIDFLWGKNADVLVYNEIINVMEKYS